MTLPGPIITKASGGVMAEGKEASCERGPASQDDCGAKDANRRDEIQENPMTDTDVSGRKCGKCGLPIHPSEIGIRHFGFFVAHSEDRCMELLKAEIARLRSPVSAPVSDVNAELVAACKHALKLLEPFDDPGLSLGLGSNALAPIRAAIANAEAESAEDRCKCGAMSEQDCNDLPNLRHCGGATSAGDPPCGDPSCNQDRERKMVRTGHTTASGRPVFCDPCIAPIVGALNAAGIHTVASCCGHGHRPGSIALADGRWLVIARNDAEHQAIERIFPTDINGNPADRAASREDGKNG